MIQFNLLPDIKLEYIKAKRTKRMVLLIASGVAGGSLAIFLLLFLSVGLQNQHINNMSEDIKRDSEQLQDIDDLDKILTVQNQLNNLTEVHEGKPVASRLKRFIPQITPQQVSYATIEINFAANTISFSGSADSLRTVNQFIDTLKFTKYKESTTNDQEENQALAEEKNAFTEVV